MLCSVKEQYGTIGKLLLFIGLLKIWAICIVPWNIRVKLMEWDCVGRLCREGTKVFQKGTK